jgi:hypothetical protein
MTERTDKKLARLSDDAKAKQKEIDQIKAQQLSILNRQKSKLATAARRKATKQKILLGAYLLKKMEANPAYRDEVLGDLERSLLDQHNRDAFGFKPLGEVQNEV